MRDFTERGHHEKIGLPDPQAGTPAPLIDVLHRVLWIIENEPRSLNEFLDEANPDGERLRLVAQVLAGAGLKGGAGGSPADDSKMFVTTTSSEQAALGKLLANWRTLMDQRLTGLPLFDQ